MRSEADADARIVMPYLTSLGIQPDQVRAQHTFSITLGRNMIHNTGERQVRSGRLDYLVVNADEKPLFIVELKAPDEDLTDADRDQGISYARLVHPIAPLVLVTNTRESRLYDTITKEPLTTAGDATLIRGAGHLSVDEDLRIRSEALEHFIGYSSENVAIFSRLQRANRIRALRGGDGLNARKYEPDLYLPRATVRSAVDAFFASSKTAFALGGASGSGKTNEMCALAEKLGETHLTLFFNGTELFGSLANVLTDEFNWFFAEALALPQICSRLARLASRIEKPILIFIDAVDESEIPTLPQELSDFTSRLEQFQGSIRVLVSAKPDEWRRFAMRRGVPSPLQDTLFQYGARTENAPAEGGPAGVHADMSIVVGPFSIPERDAAIKIYTDAFRLTGNWFPAVTELVSDPFMLRLVAEVASVMGTIPADPGEHELVRRYVGQKLARTDDPERARLELIAVAKALAAQGGSYEEWGEDSQFGRSFGGRVILSPSVAEEMVRAKAGLPMTAIIANELVANGVLVRSMDADRRARLAFAYDRVRDYLLAIHVYEFPSLSCTQFREAALAALPHGPGTAALRWYLPFTSHEQWQGFVEAATHQVEKLVNAYEAICAHVAPAVRAAMEPGATPIGAVFAGTRSGAFELAFFRRTSEELPRICYDPDTFANWRQVDAGGRIPKHLLSSSRGRHGFWFLRDPERYAAERALAELLDVIRKGRLAEDADEFLLAERVVALAHEHRQSLRLPTTVRGPELFADHFVALRLLPLDLVDLRRRAQVELGLRFYQDEHMRQRSEEKRRELKAAGEMPQYISFSSEWSGTDIQKWRERAAQEVDAGRDFTETVEGSSELHALAIALNALLPHRDRIENPLLPAPDLRDGTSTAGFHNFEDGYSDEQLVKLLEVIYGRSQSAYQRVMEASFSTQLCELLGTKMSPGEIPAVLCFRTPVGKGWNSQFRADVHYGVGALLKDSTLPESGVLVAIVYDEGPTTLKPIDASWLKVEVDSPFVAFTMEVHQMTGIVSVVWPHDAPPFVRHGSEGRMAPVRARVYDLATDALEALSAETLLRLVTGSASENKAIPLT